MTVRCPSCQQLREVRRPTALVSPCVKCARRHHAARLPHSHRLDALIRRTSQLVDSLRTITRFLHAKDASHEIDLLTARVAVLAEAVMVQRFDERAACQALDHDRQPADTLGVSA